MNNYLSPNIIECNLKKNHTTNGIGNPCPGLGTGTKMFIYINIISFELFAVY
jgi:hypothetical protein